jgi:hypothetical protein
LVSTQVDRIEELIDMSPRVSDFVGLHYNLIGQQKGQLSARAHQFKPQADLILHWHSSLPPI